MPSSSVYLPLNRELFLNYFVCAPFSKASRQLLSPKDRITVRIAAIAIAVFTLGIAIAIYRCYSYDRKTIAPANLLKMQKHHITKEFSGSDENKIKLMNSLCEHSSKFSILKFKEQYVALKGVESEEKFGDFCIRNKHQIRSFFLPHVCTFEVLGHLVNSGEESRHEEIQRLETHLLRRRHFPSYCQSLMQTLLSPGNEKIAAEKIFYSKGEMKEALLEAINDRGIDFPKFKSIYSQLKVISFNAKTSNIFLAQEVNLSKKMRMMGFACEILSTLDNPDNLPLLSEQAGALLGPLSYNEQESLRKWLIPTVQSQKIHNMISFLTPKKKEKIQEVKQTPIIKQDKIEPVTPSQIEGPSFFWNIRNRVSNIFSPI